MSNRTTFSKGTQDYYLGLDMGTDSVGWAVTDPDYHLLRFRGKDMWGVREFERAEGAADRRSKRIDRRALQRRNARIAMLKDYFSDAIAEVDPDFLARLDNSKYFLEDKDENVNTANVLFNDPDYQDKDYYRQYKTIFHLRSDLIHNTQPHDVRLVYLALLNLFKHRGHFLNAALSDSAEGRGRSTVDIYHDVQNSAREQFNIELPDLSAEQVAQMEDILSRRDLSRTEKTEQVRELLGVEKSAKNSLEVIKALCGRKVKLSAISAAGESGDEDVTFSFLDESYAEEEEKIRNAVDSEGLQAISYMKELHDHASLKELLMDKEYLSDARIELYNKHHRDLMLLKKLYRKYGTEEQRRIMFRSQEPGTYSAYVNSYNTDGHKQRRDFKKRTRDELYKQLRAVLGEWKKEHEDAEIDYVLSEMEKETFLPKQLTSANGIIPNQLHLREVKQILKNASGYLPFLREKDESGLTVAQRIEQLFSFHIPYYVGPVTTRSEENGGNGWVVRREGGRVFPWNFEQKVDLSATREKFITRMVRQCTYLEGEKTLPKMSMLFQRYDVLNQINVLAVNGRRLPVSLKQDIYRDLFSSGRKVTYKQLCSYLINQKIIQDEAELAGIDKEFHAALSSYGRMKAIFGEDLDKDRYREFAEQAIYLSTVYSDAKKALKEELQAAADKAGIAISGGQLNQLVNLNCQNWATISREFLELKGMDKRTGEIISLIDALWCTNNNLMELLNSTDFTFREVLAEKHDHNGKTLSEFTFDDLEDTYFSAPVKRMIWQTLLVIKEITEIIGKAPEKIFVETTRFNEQRDAKGKGKRKDSRAERLSQLYKNIKDEQRDWCKEIAEAGEDGKLRIKKVYLYYTQMGRDMYTGQPIPMEDLFNDNRYDIDHIYPQHYVKDDSLNNNMVLVRKDINARKSDVYPLNKEIRDNKQVTDLWKMLRKNNLITEEKYYRLTRSNGFSDEELSQFIARQIVETGQGTKGITDLLRQLLAHDSQIIYCKPKNVSDFRQEFELLKSRALNDNHHAHDAYLNIVVGNVYNAKFTQNPRNFIRETKQHNSTESNYHLSNIFNYDVSKNGVSVWKSSPEHKDPETGKSHHDLTVGTIRIVVDTINHSVPLLTRMPFTGHGGFYDATIISSNKAKEEGYLPVKTTDPRLFDRKKYGGFTNQKIAYLFLVEHKKGRKRIRTLETIPVSLVSEMEKNPEKLRKYCIDVLQLIDPDVRYLKIKIQSLVKVDGYYYLLSGKTKNRFTVRNVEPLILNREWNNYVKKLENSKKNNWVEEGISADENLKLFKIIKEKHRNTIFAKRKNPAYKFLAGREEIFMNLSIEQQVKALLQILKLSSIDLINVDLSLIGETKQAGVVTIGKEITSYEQFVLINQSITGLMENRVDLLAV